MHRVARLLARLVEIDTVNDPAHGRKPAAEAVESIGKLLASHGFRAEVLESGGYTTFYTVMGAGRPVTLFMAHYDTVPPGPGWSMDPFKPVVKDGRLYGRGSADDKSNVAAMTIALAGYRPTRGTVVVAFTGDEEVGGRHGAKMLAEMLEREDLWPDYLVNGDGSFSKVITRRRGAYGAQVSVKAEPSTAPGRVVEKVFEARLLNKGTMHSAYFMPGVDTHPLVAASEHVRLGDYRVTELEGEWVKSNVVPRSVLLRYAEPGVGRACYDEGLTRLLRAVLPLHRAPLRPERHSDYGVSVMPNMYERGGGRHTLILDVRIMTLDRSAVEEGLRAVLDEVLGDYDLRVSGGSGWLYTPRSSRLVSLALNVQAELGLPREPVEAGGASDSRYFSPRGVEAIDYGPLGGNIHGPDEYVSLEHLEKAVSFYRLVAERIHG